MNYVKTFSSTLVWFWLYQTNTLSISSRFQFYTVQQEYRRWYLTMNLYFLLLVNSNTGNIQEYGQLDRINTYLYWYISLNYDWQFCYILSMGTSFLLCSFRKIYYTGKPMVHIKNQQIYIGNRKRQFFSIFFVLHLNTKVICLKYGWT